MLRSNQCIPISNITVTNISSNRQSFAEFFAPWCGSAAAHSLGLGDYEGGKASIVRTFEGDLEHTEGYCKRSAFITVLTVLRDYYDGQLGRRFQESDRESERYSRNR